jgi:hypothetical protein
MGGGKQVKGKNFEVATIQFAYKNDELIKHLQKRGKAIG